MAHDIWSDAVRRLVPDFERETGIKVLWESYYEEGYLSQMLLNKTPTVADLDVFMARPQDNLPLFTRNGMTENLTPYFLDDQEYDFQDFTPAARKRSFVDGIQACIPVASESHVVYYRKDVFAEKGVQPPQTFDDLTGAAKKLLNLEDGFYGVLMPGQGEALLALFSGILYGFGGDWFDAETRKSTFDAPEAARAIDYYGILLGEYGPDYPTSMTWLQMQNIFLRGKGAMYLDSSGRIRTLLDPANSRLADRIGVIPFPSGPAGRRPYVATAAGIAMYSGSKRKDFAWRFIRHMTDKKRTAVIQGEYGCLGARRSAFDDPTGAKAFTPGFARALADGGGPDARPYDRPDIKNADDSGYKRINAYDVMGLSRLQSRSLLTVQEVWNSLGEAVTASIMGRDFSDLQVEANRRLQTFLDWKAAGRGPTKGGGG